MNIKDFQYIVEIADKGTLTRAAESLFVSQSTLSLFLSKLEQELNLKLFTRHKTSMIPTHAGERYIATARQIIHLHDDLMEELTYHSSSKRLRVGLASQSSIYVFSKVIRRCKRELPEIEFELVESRAIHLLDMLSKEKLDFAVCPVAALPDNLKYDVLREEKMLLVMADSHPMASYASYDFSNPPMVDLSLFANERFVLPAKGTMDRQVLDASFEMLNIKPDIAFEMESVFSACAMLEAGLGIGFMLDHYRPNIPNLKCCAFEPCASRYAILAYRSTLNLTRELEYIIAQIQTEVKSLLHFDSVHTSRRTPAK